MALYNRVYNLKKWNIFQEVLQKIKGRKEIISLAVGDNPGPIPVEVIQDLIEEAQKFSTIEGHKGYPPEEGQKELKELINQVFYQGQFSTEEIFISDGIKTDLFRFQTLFGREAKSSFFVPGYPTYKEGCQIIQSATIPIYLDHLHQFRPDMSRLAPFDVFYLCSPNNPTGVALNEMEFQKIFDKAEEFEGVIVHDACYSPYIQSQKPKTIFFTQRAKKLAIELGSFSKWAAFSGIRLSWAVVPKELKFQDQTSILEAYTAFLNATYNGVSWLSQKMGISLLKNPNLFLKEIKKTMERVQKLKKGFEMAGYKAFGGEDCPYFLVQSEVDLLEKHQILTLPLESFDPQYKGFSRVSGFVSEKNLENAITRLQNSF